MLLVTRSDELRFHACRFVRLVCTGRQMFDSSASLARRGSEVRNDASGIFRGICRADGLGDIFETLFSWLCVALTDITEGRLIGREILPRANVLGITGWNR